MPGLLDFALSDPALLQNPLFGIGTGLLQRSGATAFPTGFGANLGGAIQGATDRSIQSEELQAARERLNQSRERHQFELERMRQANQIRQQEALVRQQQAQQFDLFLEANQENFEPAEIAALRLAGPEQAIPAILKRELAADQGLITVPGNAAVLDAEGNLVFSNRQAPTPSMSELNQRRRLEQEQAQRQATQARIDQAVANEEITPAQAQSLRLDPEQAAEFFVDRVAADQKAEAKNIAAIEEARPRLQATIGSTEDKLTKFRRAKQEIIAASKGFGGSGPGAQALQGVAGTNAWNVATQLNTVKGIVGVDQLAAIRAAAKDGSSGFGQLTVTELDLITSTLGAMAVGMNPDQWERALNGIEDSLTRMRDAQVAELARIGGDEGDGDVIDFNALPE